MQKIITYEYVDVYSQNIYNMNFVAVVLFEDILHRFRFDWEDLYLRAV